MSPGWHSMRTVFEKLVYVSIWKCGELLNKHVRPCIQQRLPKTKPFSLLVLWEQSLDFGAQVSGLGLLIFHVQVPFGPS